MHIDCMNIIAKAYLWCEGVSLSKVCFLIDSGMIDSRPRENPSSRFTIQVEEATIVGGLKKMEL